MPEVARSDTYDRWAHEFSASQVETWLGCHRKWAWRRIAEVPQPQADSAAVGDSVHKQLETYEQGGDLDFTEVVHGVRIADVAQSGLHLLPDPKHIRPEWVERSFRFTSPGGFVWNGRKDLSLPDGAALPEVEGEPTVPLGAPVVLDHKSTSGIRWAKTAATLKWDVQGNLYAYEATHHAHCLQHKDCQDHPELGAACARSDPPQAADLVWTYYQTKGAKKAKRVHLRVTRQHAAFAMHILDGFASQMAAQLDAGKSASDKHEYVRTLQPNPNHCSAYGGCPYQGTCNLSIEERFISNMSDLGFFETLEAAAKAQDTPAPAPVMSDVKVDPQTRALVHTERTDLNAGSSLMGCSAADVPPATEASCVFLDPNYGKKPNEVPINPPESLLPPPQLPPELATVKGDDEDGDVTEAATTTEDKPKGRGRPKGSKNKPKEETQAELPQQASGPILPPPVQNVTTPEIQKALDTIAEGVGFLRQEPTGPSAFALFVDCRPDGQKVTYAEDLIALANERVIKESNGEVAHYKFLPYGKGAGALDIALEQVIKEVRPSAVFCPSSSDALPTLVRLAHKDAICRSVR